MPSLGGDQYKWYCEIPPLAEPGNYPGGVKTKPPFEMGVDDFGVGNVTVIGKILPYRISVSAECLIGKVAREQVAGKFVRGLLGSCRCGSTRLTGKAWNASRSLPG